MKKFLKLEEHITLLNQNLPSINNFSNTDIKFAFYFSTSLKEVFKFKESTLYFESYSKIVQFKDDHPITDQYHFLKYVKNKLGISLTDYTDLLRNILKNILLRLIVFYIII